MAHKNRGWVPAQHGAWAMLVVPYAVGVLTRVRDGLPLPWFLAPLLAFWLLAYFAFNAVSVWLKAHPARRGPLVAPVPGHGGGIFNYFSALKVINTTITGNRSENFRPTRFWDRSRHRTIEMNIYSFFMKRVLCDSRMQVDVAQVLVRVPTTTYFQPITARPEY